MDRLRSVGLSEWSGFRGTGCHDRLSRSARRRGRAAEAVENGRAAAPVRVVASGTDETGEPFPAFGVIMRESEAQRPRMHGHRETDRQSVKGGPSAGAVAQVEVREVVGEHGPEERRMDEYHHRRQRPRPDLVKPCATLVASVVTLDFPAATVQLPDERRWVGGSGQGRDAPVHLLGALGRDPDEAGLDAIRARAEDNVVVDVTAEKVVLRPVQKALERRLAGDLARNSIIPDNPQQPRLPARFQSKDQRHAESLAVAQQPMTRISEIDDEAQAIPTLVQAKQRRVVVARGRDFVADHGISPQRESLVDLEAGRGRGGREHVPNFVTERDRFRVDDLPVQDTRQRARQDRRAGPDSLHGILREPGHQHREPIGEPDVERAPHHGVLRLCQVGGVGVRHLPAVVAPRAHHQRPDQRGNIELPYPLDDHQRPCEFLDPLSRDKVLERVAKCRTIHLSPPVGGCCSRLIFYRVGSTSKRYLDEIAQQSLTRHRWWRQLYQILQTWNHAAQRLLVFDFVQKLVDRRNHPANEDRRNALLASVNEILRSQDVCIHETGTFSRVDEHLQRLADLEPAVLDAARRYQFHQNELLEISRIIGMSRPCRTREQVLQWIEETCSMRIAFESPERSVEATWLWGVLHAIERRGIEAVLLLIKRAADPREYLTTDINADEVRQLLNAALQWSPLRISARGAVQLAQRDENGSAPPGGSGGRAGVAIAENALRAFLRAASEDDVTETLVAPLLRHAGFSHIAVKGHIDKSGEYGQDIRDLKLELPSGHALYFAVQVKTGNLGMKSSEPSRHLETVMVQARTALRRRVWDPSIQVQVCVNHVYVIVAGEITEDARRYLLENVEDSNRTLLLVDGNGLMSMVRRFGLPYECAERIKSATQRHTDARE